MINIDDIINKNSKEHNKKWSFIPDHPHIILITGGSGLGKTYTLLNLMKEQDNIEKMLLYEKDLSEPKYEFFIKKRRNGNARTKHLNDSNAFIQCSNSMDDVYENIEDYNLNRKTKILIVFDDMIILFFCSKRCQIKLNALFDYENQQQERITNYCN